MRLFEDGDRPDDGSPDGRLILYKNVTDGMRWLRSIAGDEKRNLGFESRVARFAPDGGRIYYLGPSEDSICAYDVAEGTSRKMTELAGRPGKIGPYALATDGRFLYFVWRFDESDIWVMEVVHERG